MKKKLLTKYLLGYKDENFNCCHSISRIDIYKLLKDDSFKNELEKQAKNLIRYRGRNEYQDLNIAALELRSGKIELPQYLEDKWKEQEKIIKFKTKKIQREFCLTWIDKLVLLYEAIINWYNSVVKKNCQKGKEKGNPKLKE